MRSLALFDGSAQAWQSKDEFGLGASLLVAPVVTEGATARSVWLPPGTWFRVFGDVSDGPQTGTVDVTTPLEEIPVFARAGTVLVLLPANIETLVAAAPPVVDRAAVADDRELVVFLGTDGQFDEPGNLSYRLTGSAPPTGAVTWNGAALGACGTAPCGAVVGAHTATYDLVGPGTLVAGATQLAITGGAAGRKLHVTLRW